MNTTKPLVLAIVGPTASGKTSLSIKLAKAFAGEVISADSRQVYRGLDIGTGKVTTEEMDGVPHHLLDVAGPDEVFTAKDFVDQADAAIDGITERDHLPIIAGGTFFYVDLLRGKMQTAPVPPDENFRTTLEKYSNEELYELLAHKDPRRAGEIDQFNRRRLERALEIIDTLGSVPKQTTATSPYRWLVLGVDVSKEFLLEKFEHRIISWLQSGLAAEVEQLQSEGITDARFREFGFEYTLMLDRMRGVISEEELIERFVQKNWQYAKRQLTWLKRDEEIEWFKPGNVSDIFRRVETFLAA